MFDKIVDWDRFVSCFVENQSISSDLEDVDDHAHVLILFLVDGDGKFCDFFLLLAQRLKGHHLTD